MQVLVALSDRRGEVVTRDQLIQLCWEGRIVGDDAIDRCIARLRRLGDAHGAFRIETVPRVGFHLIEQAGSSARPRVRGRTILAATGVLVLALAIAGAFAWRHFGVPSATKPSRVSVEAFDVLGANPEGAALAAQLSDRVSGLLSESLPGVVVAPAGKGRERSDWTVTGTVLRVDGAWRTRTNLIDTPSGVTVWTDQFDAQVGDEDALADQVGVGVTSAVYGALAPLDQPGLKLRPTEVALSIKSKEASVMRTPMNRGDAAKLIEELVRRRPDFVDARARLAVVLVYDSSRAPAETAAGLRRRARLEADRAIRMNPHLAGAAYDALALATKLEAPTEIAKAEDFILDGLQKAPNHAHLNRSECQLLLEVGRIKDARPYCERALALDPADALIDQTYAQALALSSEPERARNAFQTFARYHRNYPPIRTSWFWMEVYGGDPRTALLLLTGDDQAGPIFEPDVREAFRLLLDARRTADPRDVDKALLALRTQKLWTDVGMADVIFGRTDEAFAALGPLKAPDVWTVYLFQKPMAPLRRDPRFWPIAARFGLVKYWRARDKWPDFCSEPGLGYDCRRQANRLVGTASAGPIGSSAISPLRDRRECHMASPATRAVTDEAC